MKEIIKNDLKQIKHNLSSTPIKFNPNNLNNIILIKRHKLGIDIKRPNKEDEINFEHKLDNYIIAEINIEENDINKNIRIINSFEEYIRCRIREKAELSEDWYKKYFPNGKFNESFINEEEIKNCEIKINDELFSFDYFHKFNKKGKYRIKYSFNKPLIRTNDMFDGCEFLTNIDLSNLNSQNVTNMNSMFSECSSLKSINFSNFNTQNVTNMEKLFAICKSLTNINLSNFNTQNVTNMSGMFFHCESLTDINLSNFNTQKVTNMEFMFYECKSLTKIDLPNFKTQNVTNMSSMFSHCESLTDINLSNFNTQNVTNIEFMFYECKSLTKIYLSNFNAKNVNNMGNMFLGCDSLINIDISKFIKKKDNKNMFISQKLDSLKKENVILI